MPSLKNLFRMSSRVQGKTGNLLASLFRHQTTMKPLESSSSRSFSTELRYISPMPGAGCGARASLRGGRKVQALHLPPAIMFRAGEVQEHVCRSHLWRGRGGAEFHTVADGSIQVKEHQWILEEIVSVG
jgi:hypothetical protein